MVVAYMSNKEMSEQSVEKNNKFASAASNINGLENCLVGACSFMSIVIAL